MALAERNRMGLEVFMLRVVIGVEEGGVYQNDEAVVGYLCG
jgi:hypothetical protein